MAASSSVSADNMTLVRLSERLADGESAQALLGELADMDTQHDTTPLRLKFLFDHGARIATGEPGCAFEKLIKIPNLLRNLMYSKVMKAMLATPGEFPLHIIARDAPGYLHEALRNVPTPEMLISLQRVDDRGRTASHWLWASDGLLVQHADQARQAMGGDPRSEDSLAKLWMGTLRLVWLTQNDLQNWGVGMDARDNDGVSAMELCLARLDAEDAVVFPNYEVCHRAMAYQDNRALLASTPPAPPRSGVSRL